MISLLGHYLLFSSVIISIAIILLNKFSYIYRLTIIQSVVMFICIFLLYVIYIQYEYQALISYNTISILMTLFFKIGSIWSSHEGSMLFWCFILIFYQQINLVHTKYSAIEQYRYMKICSVINLFFVFYTFTTSNPFISNYILTIHDSELNPILQDPILIIHPPIIYLGYLGSSIVFINTLLILYTSNLSLLYYIRIYSIYSMSILTIGITLGSWWAYHELGWGGWWFWDPVENVSLLPWIVYIIIIHNVVINIKKKIINTWILHLSLLSFMFSCYGTFFVRSGFVTSIHSFVADSTKGAIILLSILIYILMYIYLYIYNNIRIKSIDNIILYIYNNVNILIVIIISAALVFPYFYYQITKSEISIGATFYNDTIIPIIIIILLLMYYTLSNGFIFNRYNIIWSVSSILLIFYIIDYYNKYQDITIITSVIYTICIALLSMFAWKIAFDAFFKKIDHISLIHIGIIIAILAALLSNEYSTEIVTSIRPGESIKIENYIFLLRDINVYQNYKYYSMYGSILVESYQHLFSAFPEKRLYLLNNTVLSKSTILTCLETDIYCLIGDGNNRDGWYIRLYLNPYLGYMWIGAIITSISSISYIYKRFHQIIRLKNEISHRKG